MRVTRRDLAVAGALALSVPSLFLSSTALAETDDEAAVRQNVEALREALLKAGKAQLERLSADQLSYGHSDGRVQNKAEFIDGVMTRKAKVKSINFPDLKIAVAATPQSRGTSMIPNPKPTANPTMSGSAPCRSGKSRAAIGSCWPGKDTNWPNTPVSSIGRTTCYFAAGSAFAFHKSQARVRTPALVAVAFAASSSFRKTTWPSPSLSASASSRALTSV